MLYNLLLLSAKNMEIRFMGCNAQPQMKQPRGGCCRVTRCLGGG